MATIKVKSGDSSNIQKITHKVDGVDISDYTGYLLKMEVLNSVTRANAGIIRTILPEGDNSGFILALTPGDTSTLGTGEFIIVADLEKTVAEVVEFNRELSWSLTVTPSLRG